MFEYFSYASHEFADAIQNNNESFWNANYLNKSENNFEVGLENNEIV